VDTFQRLISGAAAALVQDALREEEADIGFDGCATQRVDDIAGPQTGAGGIEPRRPSNDDYAGANAHIRQQRTQFVVKIQPQNAQRSGGSA